MYSNGPLHMAKQKLGDQLEPTHSNFVWIRGVALRSCQKWWTIGKDGERGSRISVLMAWWWWWWYIFHITSNAFQLLSLTIYIHHHHHIVLVARISLTLSRHSSLSFIALGRSSGQHPVSSHSCWMYIRAGRPAFARPCVGIHKSTSLMSSSLLLQQCPACLVRLTWIVFVIEGRWPYSWCLVGCCCQDLFRIARSILV